MERSILTCGIGLVALLMSGCTHSQLRYNTVQQAGTVSEVYQQQVLNNLAMFVYDPNALPHFAFPNAGASNVTDSANVNGGLDWSRRVQSIFLTAIRLGGSATRQTTESWTLTPIANPHKLALMRCAYQKAVASCIMRADGSPLVSQVCPDCVDRWRDFYAGHSHGENECCIGGYCCWFGYGSKDDVPDCDCLLVGEYCDVYVWVLPENRDHLTRLTLEILDYALYDPAPPVVIAKRVTLYLTDKDQPATASTANKVIQADIPIDEFDSAILDEPRAAASRERLSLLAERDRLAHILATTAAPDERACVEQRLVQIERKLQALPNVAVEYGAMESGGLRNKYLPKLHGAPNGAGGILEFDQQYRALTDQPLLQ